MQIKRDEWFHGPSILIPLSTHNDERSPENHKLSIVIVAMLVPVSTDYFGAWTASFIWEHPMCRRVTANWLGASILQSNLPFSQGPKCFTKLQVGEYETEYAYCNDAIGDLWVGMTSRKLFTEASIIETTKMMFTIEDIFGLNWKYKFLRGSPFGDIMGLTKICYAVICKKNRLSRQS